jgi:hypothetical protein
MDSEQDTACLTLNRPWATTRWLVASPSEKLVARGKLPGAAGYDETIRLFRRLRAQGVSSVELLPAALPNSWMVNSRAPSAVFQYWMSAQFRPTWTRLLDLLDGAKEGIGALSEQQKQTLQTCVSSLCVKQNGIADLSKVLSLLAPDVVPLMDDAAVHFALNLVERPADVRVNKSPSRAFLPMLEWLAAAQQEREAELNALAASYPLGSLSAAQILDRLLWFESWGYHLFRTQPAWVWVRDEQDEAILNVNRPEVEPAPSVHSAIELAAEGKDLWSDQCRTDLNTLAQQAG